MSEAVSESRPALLTPAQAAKVLGVSRSTVYELLNAGKLPSIHVLRCRRIRRTDLDRIVAEGC